MSFSDRIQNEYFEYLYDYVCEGRAHNGISYKKLFMLLHDIEFTFTIDRDSNRASDGIELRRNFAYYTKPEEDYDIIVEILDKKPCSVLEMMIGLSIRCDEYLDDPRYGDRLKQWFWTMLKTLGLNMMTDDRFDRNIAEIIILRFLNREYDYDGKGGLFYIPKCNEDLRKLEIWTQLCWFLNSFS